MNELRAKPKILTVDDKPQNLFALEKLLDKLEVEVIQTTSGSEALALVLEHDFCLAIVDVQMPEIDGYELVELLRGNLDTASLPVIFVSAIYSDEYHHRKGYDAGAVDFLSKPFIPEIFLSKVRVFVELYHQRVKLQDLINQLNTNNETLENEVRQRQQAETALQQANAKLSKRATQLETSSQVGQQATSILDLDRLLVEVVRLIQAKFDYYFVGVWLFNEQQDAVVLQAGIGSGGTQQPKPGFSIPLDTGTSILVWVCQSGQDYLANDVSSDARYMALKALPETRSELALPLRIGQETIGVLDILSDQAGAFELEDKTVLQTLADQIAIAIRNASLYESEKKLREVEAEKARELAKLHVSKDKFFTTISQDLRSPFNTLLGNSDLILKDMDRLAKEEIQEIGERIYTSAGTVHSLVETLLTWFNMQRGRIGYQPAEVELRQVVDRVVEWWRETADRKNIELNSKVEEDILVCTDENMLEAVLRNLMANGLKFTQSGGSVTISAQPVNLVPASKGNRTGTPTEFIAVSVTDTGVGLSQENQAKLFKIGTPHSTPGTAKEKGLGLGLIMCKEMVEHNRGQIWIESKLGQGTTVRFTVPVATLAGCV